MVRRAAGWRDWGRALARFRRGGVRRPTAPSPPNRGGVRGRIRPAVPRAAARARSCRARRVQAPPRYSARPSCRERSRFPAANRSEEHTSELQSLMRISYAVFCLKKKKPIQNETQKKLDATQNKSQEK